MDKREITEEERLMLNSAELAELEAMSAEELRRHDVAVLDHEALTALEAVDEALLEALKRMPNRIGSAFDGEDVRRLSLAKREIQTMIAGYHEARSTQEVNR